MTSENFCFHLQNRLIQTSQTGGQQYNDTFPFSIPWFVPWTNTLQDETWAEFSTLEDATCMLRT